MCAVSVSKCNFEHIMDYKPGKRLPLVSQAVLHSYSVALDSVAFVQSCAERSLTLDPWVSANAIEGCWKPQLFRLPAKAGVADIVLQGKGCAWQ